jgi:protein-S-isoprenylcysteine O-methyltransferase Ste14
MSKPKTAERGAQVRFFPPLVFVGFILFGIALQYAVTPIPFPIDRWITLTAGILISLIGLSLIVMANMLFRRTGQEPAPWTPTPELLLEGPYRFTRNPMYLGLTLIQVGLGLAVNNLWISLLAVPALLVVHFIAVLPEERYLTKKFGKNYKAYLAKVRRYL